MFRLSEVLSKFLVEEKIVWFPKHSKNLHQIDGFAWQLRLFNLDIVNPIPRIVKCPSFSVHFTYYGDGNERVNAFATKLRFFNNRHVVGISKSLILQLHKIIFEKSFISSIQQHLKVLKGHPKEDISILGCALLFSFITNHELGHIVGGHGKYQTAEFQGPKKQFEVFGARQTAHERAYYLCECDADAVGGAAVGVFAISLAKKYCENNKISFVDYLSDVIQIACASIYILFAIFDNSYRGPSPHYPEPAVRVNWLMAHLSARAVDYMSEPEVILAVVKGVQSALKHATQLGLGKGNYDALAAQEAWMKILPELKILNLKLKKFKPIQQQDNSCLSGFLGMIIRCSLQFVLSGRI